MLYKFTFIIIIIINYRRTVAYLLFIYCAKKAAQHMGQRTLQQISKNRKTHTYKNYAQNLSKLHVHKTNLIWQNNVFQKYF